ncbi:hypothetical protein D9M68_740830 [compost metagenome]
MAEIDIERLGTRHREENGADDHEGEAKMGRHEFHPEERIERPQHGGVFDDVHQPRKAEHEEPQPGYRAKHDRHLGRAKALDEKHPDNDDEGDRHHPALHVRRHELDALDRRQHRHGRGNNGVAKEHGGTHDAQHRDPDRRIGESLAGQRHQRQRAAFAIVIGAGDEEHIFERHGQRQRPHDEREQAQHLVVGLSDARADMHGLAEGVDRTGADIAINHAQCPHQEHRKIFAGM